MSPSNNNEEEKQEDTESSLSSLPPNNQHSTLVVEKSNKSNKEESSFAEEDSVTQPLPPPTTKTTQQQENLKAEKHLKKEREFVCNKQPEIHPSTEPHLLSPSNPSPQEQHNNDSVLLEIHPDSGPDPFHRQQQQTHTSNNGTMVVSDLEEHPVIEHPVPFDQANNKRNAISMPTTTAITTRNETRTVEDNRETVGNNTGNGGNADTRTSTVQDIEQGASPNNNNQQQENSGQEGPQVLEINDAFRVLTPEEQRRQRWEEQRQNYLLIEGQAIPSRRPSLTPNEEQAQQTKKENRRLIILFFVSSIVLVIVLVPSLLLTDRNNNNLNIATATISPSPSSNPSTSLSPSFSPSTSIVPSSFPTTSSPTSTAFDDVVTLLGLDEGSLSLNPDNYVFRSVRWMADQDQITRAILFRQKTGTEQQQQQNAAAVVQRFALVCLYFATGGDSSWTSPLGFLNAFTHECQWQVFGRQQQLLPGATINCADNVILGIALNDNNLRGTIPNEIGLLTRLLWLELRNNEIRGTLPSSLSRLSQLGRLYLDGNMQSGSIPSVLMTLNNLSVLWLDFNGLTGSIPDSIGNLTNLIALDLSNNFLTGSIPSSIGIMEKLQLLGLQFNVLTSTMPTEINNLEQLVIYSVRGNSLTGTLPFEAGSNPFLKEFSCARNELTGDISRLVHLSRLTRLIFDFNKFTGTIPREICSLPLEFIVGAENLLTGSLPDCLSNLTSLTHIIFNINNLVGSIPRLPTSLKSLTLWRNKLTGRIPTGPFPSMTNLNLFSNNFIPGTIPTEIFTATNLQNLNFQSCQLLGTIPTEIGLLTQLGRLDLSINRLFGSIPSEIGLLRNLQHLQLAANNLRGSIPSEMGRLTSLQDLFLNANFLTGRLPSTFVSLPVATFGRLALQNNSLMGDVGFFCMDRTFGVFLANCLELTSCTCCTGCCDRRNIIVGDECSDIFNNL